MIHRGSPRLTERGEVNNMCGFIFFKEPSGLLWVPMEAAKLRGTFPSARRHTPQIPVLRRDEHPLLILTPSEFRTYRLGLDDMLYRRPDEARATSDEDDRLGVLDRLGHDG